MRLLTMNEVYAKIVLASQKIQRAFDEKPEIVQKYVKEAQMVVVLVETYPRRCLMVLDSMLLDIESRDN